MAEMLFNIWLEVDMTSFSPAWGSKLNSQYLIIFLILLFRFKLKFCLYSFFSWSSKNKRIYFSYWYRIFGKILTWMVFYLKLHLLVYLLIKSSLLVPYSQDNKGTWKIGYYFIFTPIICLSFSFSIFWIIFWKLTISKTPFGNP